MQLSKRLKAVADLVTPGNRVADIGCDHAYTSIYLCENDISPYIVAMDVNQGPIDKAKENILRYGYETKIEVRKSDGLEKLRIGEVDTILIAGMGGALMNQILTDHIEVFQSSKELILQPQSEAYKVRQLLQEYDFIIIEENMILEDGKYYVMVKALHGNDVQNIEEYKLTKEEHFHYGRLLLERKHTILKKFLLWDYSLCEGIMGSLINEKSENSVIRQGEIKDRMMLIQTGLHYFSD